jgi:hypothetical protein
MCRVGFYLPRTTHAPCLRISTRCAGSIRLAASPRSSLTTTPRPFWIGSTNPSDPSGRSFRRLDPSVAGLCAALRSRQERSRRPARPSTNSLRRIVGRTGSSAAAPRRQARYRGPRRRALADGRTARPGADHRRLHDPLHADGPYRPHSARALSDARHAVRELRGATRIPGDLPRRICRAAKRVSGRSVSTLGTLSRRSTEQPTLGMPHTCAVFADS